MEDQISTQELQAQQKQHDVAAARMAGFDDLPRDLRLFLHEYVAAPWAINSLLGELKAGRAVTVKHPDGKLTVLRP